MIRRVERDAREAAVAKAAKASEEVREVLRDLIECVVEENQMEAIVLPYIPGELWFGPPPVVAQPMIPSDVRLHRARWLCRGRAHPSNVSRR